MESIFLLHYLPLCYILEFLHSLQSTVLLYEALPLAHTVHLTFSQNKPFLLNSGPRRCQYQSPSSASTLSKDTGHRPISCPEQVYLSQIGAHLGQIPNRTGIFGPNSSRIQAQSYRAECSTRANTIHSRLRRRPYTCTRPSIAAWAP
ncbi:hypothetical protein EDD21DRAFT_242060 [Dissophora ornata]|nr:hypothetical protein EDD21DRAFT_242060 [Dissophora ornata]